MNISKNLQCRLIRQCFQPGLQKVNNQGGLTEIHPNHHLAGRLFSKLLVSIMYLRKFENNSFPDSIQTHVQLILTRICSKFCFQKILTLSIDQGYRKKADMLTDFNSCTILNFRVMMIMLRRVVEDFIWERQLKELQQLVQDLPSSLAHRISLLRCQVDTRKAGDTNF